MLRLLMSDGKNDLQTLSTSKLIAEHLCRGLLYFDYISAERGRAGAIPVSDNAVADALRQAGVLSLGRGTTNAGWPLTPPKGPGTDQLCRLRIASPTLNVTAAQVWFSPLALW